MENKMNTIRRTGNSFVYLSLCLVAVLSFAVTAAGDLPPTNQLVTGGNYNITPPPTNMMFRITNNETNVVGDDNLVWSNSGRMLALDRAYLNQTMKFIYLVDVSNLGDVQALGARTSPDTHGLFANITSWTWNDDRVLFCWQGFVYYPQPEGKSRLMSCTSSGPTNVSAFLMADPQGDPTNHVYSPSVIYDPVIDKERLLCVVSTADENPIYDTDTATRWNLYTVPFDSGGIPDWNDRVQLTAFDSNMPISSAKWCPELGTNYQPLANRLVILFIEPQSRPDHLASVETNKIVVFNGVQGVIANPETAPTSLADSHLVIVETNLLMRSQVSWTFDGQYVMFGRLRLGAFSSSDIYSKRANSPTNEAVRFMIPEEIIGGTKEWLSISPDGMKAAFTVDYQAYVIPLQFDNDAVTGAAVTNILTDASYTAVDVSGDAIDSSTTFSIVAPPSVDIDKFNGEFSGYAREFSVSGVSSQFNLATNAEMTLHFSQADIPTGASITNLAIYVYNPEGSDGQTGTWDKLDSVINTDQQTIMCEAEHFSVYAIGRASDQSEIAVATTALAADFDGDGLADPAVYNTNGNWKIKLSTANYVLVTLADFLGGSGYTPLAADFDGDGLADPTIYNAALELWATKLSSLNYLAPTVLTSFGGIGWQAVAGDFDGDGLADPALYNTNGTWKAKLSTANYLTITSTDLLGYAGWTAIAADFDGDGKVDPTIHKASTGSWIVLMSKVNYVIAVLEPGFLGYTGYTAFAADFDGDAYADPAVAKTLTGKWKIKLSSGNYALVDLPGFLGE